MKILTRLFAKTTASEPAETPSTTTASTGSSELMLQDLVLLKVPVSWQEAVSVCLEWLEGHAAASCPDPAVVSISSIGELRLVSSRPLKRPQVQRAAEFLTALLADAAAPDPLRELLQADATSTPLHASLEDFARALAYFGRPDRRADVAAVHTRAEAIYAKAAADKELERLRANAQHERKAAAPAAVPIRRRLVQAAAVAVLAGIIAVSGYVLVSLALQPGPEGGPPRYTEEDPTAKATDVTPPSDLPKAAPTSDAPAAAGSSGRATATSGVVAEVSIPPGAGPADASTLLERARVKVQHVIDTALAAAGMRLTSRPPAKPVPDASRATRPRRSVSPSSPASGDSVTAPDEAVGPDGTFEPVEYIVSVREVTRAEIAAAEGVVESAPHESDARHLAPEPEASSAIFSDTDADVSPARLLRPQLPTQVRPGSSELIPPIGVLELVVNEHGKVERVSLRSRSNRLNEKMLLAAGKAWSFEPARLDGLPVRYLVRVAITE